MKKILVSLIAFALALTVCVAQPQQYTPGNQVSVDPANFTIISGDDAQEVFESIDDQFGSSTGITNLLDGGTFGTVGQITQIDQRQWIIVFPAGSGSGGAATPLASAPVGSVVAYMGSSVPANWLECDGTALATNDYPALFEAIGTNYGFSAPNFNIPDLRGLFLRGRDDSRGMDPGATNRLTHDWAQVAGDLVGSVQSNYSGAIAVTNPIGAGATDTGFHYGTGTTYEIEYDWESRPVNASVMWIIRVVGVDSYYSGETYADSGRLTPVSGDPVPTGTSWNVATLYFTPYKGSDISLSDGTQWSVYSFNEMTSDLSSLTLNRVHDFFLHQTNGTVMLTNEAWATIHTRNIDLAMVDGIWTLSSDVTKRYVGSAHVSGTFFTQDTDTYRLIYNAQNRVRRSFSAYDTNEVVWQQTSMDVWERPPFRTNFCYIVYGLPEEPVSVEAKYFVKAGYNARAAVGIGIEASTNQATLNTPLGSSAYSYTRWDFGPVSASYLGYPPIGLSAFYLTTLSKTNTVAGKPDFYGLYQDGVTFQNYWAKSGMEGWVNQ